MDKVVGLSDAMREVGVGSGPCVNGKYNQESDLAGAPISAALGTRSNRGEDFYMTTIRKVHRKPYRMREDLTARLASLQDVIAQLRDSSLPIDSKKRMLNHAVWEVSIALGNFAPEFRSKGVLEGRLGAKIEREHVFKRKQIVADVLANKEPLPSILKRVIHCVVTKEEHAELKNVLDAEDGWARYRAAGIEVFRCSKDVPERA